MPRTSWLRFVKWTLRSHLSRGEHQIQHPFSPVLDSCHGHCSSNREMFCPIIRSRYLPCVASSYGRGIHESTHGRVYVYVMSKCTHPPSWTGIQIRSSSAQRQPRPQIRSSQLNSCASSNYLFAVGLPIVSTCITTNSPRDTESRSSGRHSQGFGCGRQSEMKCCAPSIVRRGPQVASVRFHNGAADG